MVCLVGRSTAIENSLHDMSLIPEELGISGSRLEVDSAFHPYEVGKMSTQLAGGKVI